MVYPTQEARPNLTRSIDSQSRDSKTLRSESTPSSSRSATLEPDSDPGDEDYESVEEDDSVPIELFFRPVIEEESSGAEQQLERVEAIVHFSPTHTTFRYLKLQVQGQSQSLFGKEVEKYLSTKHPGRRNKRLNVNIEHDIRAIWPRPMERRLCLNSTWTPQGHRVVEENWERIQKWLGEGCQQRHPLRGVRLEVERTASVG
ncbi:hypothetical protein LTR36_000070 [Oleoguttula mirabilis]|uniref:Uncharacterized protein n=1 Tax=Oleoguttula mirabilis TaxID=1507867 RepID=A0AAV9JZF8_9PEZI|nr:hypothetical protein LTR36_000070 [Oleoguttula mirabilis]